MTKADLINSVAEKANITKKDAEMMVSTVFTSITEALANGEKVALTGFGTFEVRERAARTGINPQTKETITIAASKSPVFKAGAVFKNAVAK